MFTLKYTVFSDTVLNQILDIFCLHPTNETKSFLFIKSLKDSNFPKGVNLPLPALSMLGLPTVFFLMFPDVIFY